jgi:membrane protease YdiL (CAAX protease family)
VVIGQSASEELLFRGWVQPVLVRGWGPAAAILITALAFAALHVAGGARTPLTLVNLMLGGILFGLLAWRSGGLAAPIAAHAGWNWAEAILFGLDPNPGAGGFGAIHDLDLLGTAWWGGSAEGLNASLAMTLTLVALILPLAVTVPLRRPVAV